MKSTGLKRLQWGRACEDADRMKSPLSRLSESFCFNGAAPVRTRIEARRALDLDVDDVLQWGRACEDADSTASTCWPTYSAALQWGRACEDADRRKSRLRRTGLHGFNGAAPVRTRIERWQVKR